MPDSSTAARPPVSRLRRALEQIAARGCDRWRCGLDDRPCSPYVAREALGGAGKAEFSSGDVPAGGEEAGGRAARPGGGGRP